MTDNFDDPIGPGTPAWEHSEAAMTAGVRGDQEKMKEELDAMTRELINNNASTQTIREWENFVHATIDKKMIDEFGEWVDQKLDCPPTTP